MTKKPEGCATCPLFEKGKGFVPDQLSRYHRVAFIGEAPGKNEVEKSAPFVGKAGFVLENWLLRAVPTLQLSKDKNELSLMNTLRCLPPEIQGRPYPRGEEKLAAEECCRQYNPKMDTVHTVVLFGESPQRAWFGDELSAEDASDRRMGREGKGVMGRIGRVYEKDGKRWVFAPHPAYILRQPALVEHGQRALQIAANDEREILPDYVRWDTAIEVLR